MGKDTPKRFRNGHYSLRQTLVFSKRFCDFKVEITSTGYKPSSSDVDSCLLSPADLLRKSTKEAKDGTLISNTVDFKGKKGDGTVAWSEESEGKAAPCHRNAAVIPDLFGTAPIFQQQSCTVNKSVQDEPLLIHGYSVTEYQKIYHSVVDPMLTTPDGQQRAYTLQLGRQIKQELWKRLSCPQVTAEPQADGHYQITESFLGAGHKCEAPNLKVDISGEPRPQQPKKKARHCSSADTAFFQPYPY